MKENRSDWRAKATEKYGTIESAKPDTSWRAKARERYGVSEDPTTKAPQSTGKEEPNFYGQAPEMFMTGVGSMIERAGGALKWLGADETGQSFVDYGKEIVEENEYVSELKNFSWDDLSEAKGWSNLPKIAFEGLLTSAPEMAATLPIGGVFGKVGVKFVSKVGPKIAKTLSRAGASEKLASKTVRTVLGKPALQGAGQTAAIGVLEGGGTYQELIEAGIDPDKASEAAQDVFADNMALVLVNAPQFAYLFGGKKGQAKAAQKIADMSRRRRFAIGGTKALGNAGGESIEEVYQGASSSSAIDRATGESDQGTFDRLFDPEYLKSDRVAQEAAAGFGAGLGLSGGGFASRTVRESLVTNASSKGNTSVKVSVDMDAPAEEKLMQLQDGLNRVEAAKVDARTNGEDLEPFDKAISTLKQQINQTINEVENEQLNEGSEVGQETTEGEQSSTELSPEEEQETEGQEAGDSQENDGKSLPDAITKAEKDWASVEAGKPVSERTGGKVRYKGYTGTLQIDESGNVVIDTGGEIVEVPEAGKDTEVPMADAGIEPVATRSRNYSVEGKNITITEQTEGEGAVDKNYQFLRSNFDDTGTLVSVTLQNEKGQEVTVRDQDMVDDIAFEQYFNQPVDESMPQEEQRKARVQKAQETIDNAYKVNGVDNVLDAIINTPNKKIDRIFEKLENGEEITARDKYEAQKFIEQKTSEILDESTPVPDDVKEKALAILEEFQNEINEVYENPPEQTPPTKPNEADSNEPGGQGQGSQEIDPNERITENDQVDRAFRGVPEGATENKSDTDGVQYYTDDYGYANVYKKGTTKAKNTAREEYESKKRDLDGMKPPERKTKEEVDKEIKKNLAFASEEVGQNFSSPEELFAFENSEEYNNLSREQKDDYQDYKFEVEGVINDNDPKVFKERQSRFKQDKAKLEEEVKNLEKEARDPLNKTEIKGKSFDLGIDFETDGPNEIFKKLKALGIATRQKKGDFLDPYHKELKAFAEKNGIDFYKGIKGGAFSSGGIKTKANEYLVTNQYKASPQFESEMETSQETQGEYAKKGYEVREDSGVKELYRNGKKVGRSSKNWVPAMREHYEQNYEQENEAYRVDRDTENPPRNTGEYQQRVANESDNVYELAINYRDRKETIDTNPDDKEKIIADEFKAGYRVTPEEYADFRGQDMMSESEGRPGRRLYLKKKGSGNQAEIDTKAEQLSANTGIEITPEDIIDFIDNYETVQEFESSRQDEVVSKIKDRFKEITDIELTDEIADEYIDIEYANRITEIDSMSDSQIEQEFNDLMSELDTIEEYYSEQNKTFEQEATQTQEQKNEQSTDSQKQNQENKEDAKAEKQRLIEEADEARLDAEQAVKKVERLEREVGRLNKQAEKNQNKDQSGLFENETRDMIDDRARQVEIRKEKAKELREAKEEAKKATQRADNAKRKVDQHELFDGEYERPSDQSSESDTREYTNSIYNTEAGKRLRRRRGNDGKQNPINIGQVIKKIAEALKMPIRKGRMITKGAGEYNRKTGVARVKELFNIDVIAHEGGHRLYSLYGDIVDAMWKNNPEETNNWLVEGHENMDPQLLKEEGFAEFFRYYILNPEWVQNRSQQMYAQFEEQLELRSPELATELKNAQDKYTEYIMQSQTDAVASEIVNINDNDITLKNAVANGDVIHYFKTRLRRAYTHYIDQLNPGKKILQRLQEVYYENTGEKLNLKAAEDFYKLMRLGVDAFSEGNMAIEHGVQKYKSTEIEGSSLKDALHKAFGKEWTEEKHRDFGAYLAARRLVHKWDQRFQGIIPNDPSKYSKEQLLETIEEYEQKYNTEDGNFAEAAEMIYEFNQALWKKKKDAGLISNEAFAEGMEMNPDYVPIQRDMRDKTSGSSGSTSDGRSSIIKRFTGSDRNIINPIESMMQDAFMTEKIIKRNEAIEQLRQLAETAGEGAGRWVEEIPESEWKPYVVDATDVLNKMKKDDQWGLDSSRDAYNYFLEEMSMDAEKNGAEFPGQYTLFQLGAINVKGEPIIFSWKDGKRRAIRLSDEPLGREVYDMLVNNDRQTSSFALETAAKISNALRVGITTAPEFAVANIFRDQIAAWVLTDTSLPKQIMNTIRGFKSEINQDDDARLYRSFAGLSTQNVAALDPNQTEKEIQKLKDKNYVVRRLKSFRAFAELTDLSEISTRIGIFKNYQKKYKEKGYSDYEAAIEAAYQARDYIDFGRHGSKMLAARKVVTFMNAAIQSIDKTARTIWAEGNMKKHIAYAMSGNLGQMTEQDLEMAKIGRRAIYKITALGAFGAALSALYADDEEYDEINKGYLRATHWMVKEPVSGEWLAIPKPYELAIVSNTLEAAIEGYSKQDPTWTNTWAESMQTILAPPIAPPILKVPVEVWANRNTFSEMPIVPRNKIALDPMRQYTDYTSDFGKWFGKNVGVSPAVVDHVVTGFTGSWGRYILSASNSVKKNAPVQEAEDKPVLRRFIKNADRGSFSEQTFWKKMSRENGQIAAKYETFADLLETGTTEEAMRYYNKLDLYQKNYVVSRAMGESVGLQNHPLERAEKASSIISKMRDEVRDDPNIDPKVKTEIDNLMDRLATVEYRNALITSGIPSHKNRAKMSWSKVMNKILSTDRKIYDTLVERFWDANINPDQSEDHDIWREVRNEYKAEDIQRFLQDEAEYRKTEMDSKSLNY